MFHTQNISSRIKVRETLYFANPFKIKFKVTLNIGVTEVNGHHIIGSSRRQHFIFSMESQFEQGKCDWK